MSRYRSPLANFVDNPRDVRNRPTPKPWGLMVHTTGRGIIKRARKLNTTPLEAAVALYTEIGQPFAHYVMDQDGTIIQIADEREAAWHAGIPAAQRKLYGSGKWREKVPTRPYVYWLEHWGLVHKKLSPTDLYPTASPNQAYVGIELIPNRRATFSEAQYRSLSEFGREFFVERHKIVSVFPGMGPLPTPRFLGHEDVEPLERWEKVGGWDPGALRAKPRFDWSRIF